MRTGHVVKRHLGGNTKNEERAAIKAERIAKKQRQHAAKAAAGGDAAALSPAEVERELLHIFGQHNPEKVATVPKLMVKYAGTEDAFLKAVRKKYGVVAEPQDDGPAAAPGADEEVETVSLSVLQELRAQESVANCDSDDDEEETPEEKVEREAVAARVALRKTKGDKLLRQGHHAKALATFEDALALDPENEELLEVIKQAKRAKRKADMQLGGATAGGAIGKKKKGKKKKGIVSVSTD